MPQFFARSKQSETAAEPPPPPGGERPNRCDDLPSKPNREIGTVLVSGATGYVGGRLVPELIARGYRVRVLVRAASSEYKSRWPEAEIAVAEALHPKALKEAMRHVDVVYYLIHSLLLGPGKFESADIRSAVNFRLAAEANRVKRIIYLGGLGDASQSLSPHLRSRTRVAQALSDGPIPVTILRAAIIIGSGSASYEIIKYLIKNSPILPLPSWGRTRCQPISIRDVIKYLVACLEVNRTNGRSYDIGGGEILPYEQMIKKVAKVLGKRRLFIRFPLSNITAFAYFASLVTPVPAQITISLMKSLKNEVICQSDSIKDLIPFGTVPFEVAIKRALYNERRDRIHTRWSDAYPRGYNLLPKLNQLEFPPEYAYTTELTTEKSLGSLYDSVCQIGGKEGYFDNTWIWSLRGLLDRILMGVGGARGRRSLRELRVNDVIGFWRVETLQRNRLVLLRAEMKLPGRGWLKFKMQPESDRNRLSVTAHFQPNGLFGRIYWYALLPIHNIIIRNLAIQIEKRSVPESGIEQ